MSGGYFNYKEYELSYLGGNLTALAEETEDAEVRKKARTLSKKLFSLFKEIKQLDLYLSGDSSEITANLLTKSREVK